MEKQIRTIFGIVLSVVLVAAAICLMIACVNIYNSGGEQIYTPEKVAQAFRPIALVVYLAIALTVAGFLLHLLLPGEKLRIRLGKNEPLILKKLHEKLDYTLCGDYRVRTAIAAEQKERRQMRWFGFLLLAVGSFAFLTYALDPDTYESTDITGIMVQCMYRLLPCMAVPFAFGIYVGDHAKYSIRREISLMKLVAMPRQPVAQPRKAATKLPLVRMLLLLVALGFIAGGFLADGWIDVLTKAVNICTECVGLG